MRHRSLVCAAGFVALASCSSDKTTGIDGGVSGSVSFTYTGAGQTNASYSATGSIATSASTSATHTTTWAAGYKDNNDNSTNIAANFAKANNLADVFVTTIARQTVGSSTIDPNCQSTATSACTDVVLALNEDAQRNFGYACILNAGNVTITAVSGTNAQGTFQGTGTCVQTVSPFAVSNWTVANGSFNVPLLTSPPNLP